MISTHRLKLEISRTIFKKKRKKLYILVLDSVSVSHRNPKIKAQLNQQKKIKARIYLFGHAMILITVQINSS